MSSWKVVCLCADWCGSCREYRAVFDGVARRNPDVAFEWIDVEDEADRIGDVDIETFPTLLVSQGEEARFFSPMLPHAELLSRLLSALRSETAAPNVSADGRALLARLRN